MSISEGVCTPVYIFVYVCVYLKALSIESTAIPGVAVVVEFKRIIFRKYHYMLYTAYKNHYSKRNLFEEQTLIVVKVKT